MVRSDLIEIIAAQNPQMSKADVERVVHALFETITEALSQGQRVEVRGFGVFSGRTIRARQGRNPKTGEVLAIPEISVPAFKAGKALREKVNAATA
jgi:integration host factor subunit beta